MLNLKDCFIDLSNVRRIFELILVYFNCNMMNTVFYFSKCFSNSSYRVWNASLRFLENDVKLHQCLWRRMFPSSLCSHSSALISDHVCWGGLSAGGGQLSCRLLRPPAIWNHTEAVKEQFTVSAAGLTAGSAQENSGSLNWTFPDIKLSINHPIVSLI